MSFEAPHHLLLRALILPAGEAEETWRRWRASTDLDRLDSGSFHMLAALAGRMDTWLRADDPQRPILLGICRRAWSQNHLRLKDLSEAAAILRSAGIEKMAAIGPVLWGARYWPAGAVRSINTVDILVEPHRVRQALDVLLKAGWTAADRVPNLTGSQFYFDPAIRLRAASGGDVRLHWRALPNTDFSLRRPPAPSFEPAPSGHLTAYSIPLEHSLVAALGQTLSDGTDWRGDALMICQQSGIRWDTVRELLRWRGGARLGLDELRRDWGAPVPLDVTAVGWTGGVERMLAGWLRSYRLRKKA
jgi:hypothetical protein